MHSEPFVKRKLQNWLHSAVLFLGMVLLFAVIGSLIGGTTGVILLALFGFVLFLLTSKVGPQMVLWTYRARPLTYEEAPRLLAAVAELSERAGLPQPPRLYYVPSQMVNAFSVGQSRNAAVAITDGIIRHLSFRELVGVLAHEISHIKHNDLFVMGLADMVNRTTSTLSLLGQFLLFVNLPLILMGGYRLPWLAIVLLIFAPTVSSLLQLGLSRSREYDADLEAARLTGDPEGLASALVKLERLEASFLERIFLPGRRIPEPSLLRTHPKTEERVRRLMELKAELERPQPTPEETALLDLVSIPTHELRNPRWRVLGGLWY